MFKTTEIGIVPIKPQNDFKIQLVQFLQFVYVITNVEMEIEMEKYFYL